MEKQTADRRIRKTKKLLRDTLIELMNEKPLEKISVKDLTERADLNRGTFYLHYLDIFDLLEKSENELLNEMSEIISKIDPTAFIAYNQTNKSYPPLVELFEWFSVNKNFGNALMGHNGNISFLLKIEAIFKNEFQKINHKLPGTDKNAPVNVYLESFIIFGFTGVMKQWIESDMHIPPKEMAKILVQILCGSPSSHLAFAPHP